MKQLLLAGLLSCCVVAPLQAAEKPDYEREQRLVDEIRDVILDGDVIDLNDGSRDFMAIHMEADEPKGTVILLHGRGFHADWQDTIQPLRIGLTEEGWSTLSLQMPVLEKSAKYYDYVPIFPEAGKRIEAAIKFLKETKQPIILLAHSCGVHMAMQWVRDYDSETIDGFIGLGMGATDYKQPMKQDFPLADMKNIPILDLYGSEDYPAVKRLAPERLAMIQKAGHPASQQLVLDSADHYLKDQGENATQSIASWLNSIKF